MHGELPARECAQVDWQAITLERQLGQGASGVIHRARLQGHDAPVAVKLYKGDITSDGSPLLEMQACIAAGNHEHLIPLIGRVDNHPQGIPVLVMELIDSAWFNLAGPPSLDSCTRDIYPVERRLDGTGVKRLALAIASVGAHLHGRGISHGDLYGHNILCDAQGHSLLGDFGAASFHDADGSVAARLIERIEVRAFGVLLGELLACCGEASEELADLQASCVQPQVLARPDFAQVERVLRRQGRLLQEA